MTLAADRQIRSTDSIFRPALLLMSGRIMAFAATSFIPVILAGIFDRAEFGTYKQLFLIYTTVFLIAQIGMSSSLYFFLPRFAAEAGRFVANSALCLAASGLACLGFLALGGPWLARWFSNPGLEPYMIWIGLFLSLMMVSSLLEIVMVSRGRYLWASVSYALSDLTRAAALIIPALIVARLDAVLKAAVGVAALRAGAMMWYLRREFGGGLRPDAGLLKRQLLYALPFGMAVVVEIAQSNLHQYAVSHRFDPATFAVYAVGCVQIPFVDFVANPTSDVMMVKMQERLAEGRQEAVLRIWHETTRKLALLFFPLAGFLAAAAKEMIVFAFPKYAASAPVFAVWSAGVMLAVFQIDGVLRVYAETRFLLAMNLMRLAIIASLVGWFLSEFYLLGAVLVTMLAALAGKAAALIRIKKLLCADFAGVLPWRNLAAVWCAAIAAATIAMAAKPHLPLATGRNLPTFTALAATAGIYGAAYAAMLWHFGLLRKEEKLAVTGWFRQAVGAAARAFS
jgi:O-antigen/teichoic acid export membrane protein